MYRPPSVKIGERIFTEGRGRGGGGSVHRLEELKTMYKCGYGARFSF